MFADIDDFRNGKTFADGVKGERVVSDVFILPARGAHQVPNSDADMEGAGNRATIAHLAEDHVAMQLDLDLLASIDALGENNTQPGARDVKNGSIERLGWALDEFELSRIVGGISSLRAAVGLLFGGEERLGESSRGMIKLVCQL